MSKFEKHVLILSSRKSVQYLAKKAEDFNLGLLQYKHPRGLINVAAKNLLHAFFFDFDLIHNHNQAVLEQFSQKYPSLPLFAVLKKEQQVHTIELLQSGVRACLSAPLDVGDFAYHLTRLKAEKFEIYDPFSMISEVRHITMPSDLSLVVQVVKNLVNTTMPMEDKGKYQVIVGLNEIINNAIEHGNLGITFQEKSEAFKNSSFFELAIERAHQSPYNGREVHIWAQAFPSQGRVEFKVEDQGSGFDWRNLPNPREGANVLKHHGRGILIAEYAFDQVKFNEKGNCVTLVYKIPASQYQKSNICRI